MVAPSGNERLDSVTGFPASLRIPVDLSMGSRAQTTQVAAVEDRIRHQFHVGDLVSGRQWISGTVSMEWAPMRDDLTEHRHD